MIISFFLIRDKGAQVDILTLEVEDQDEWDFNCDTRLCFVYPGKSVSLFIPSFYSIPQSHAAKDEGGFIKRNTYSSFGTARNNTKNKIIFVRLSGIEVFCTSDWDLQWQSLKDKGRLICDKKLPRYVHPFDTTRKTEASEPAAVSVTYFCASNKWRYKKKKRIERRTKFSEFFISAFVCPPVVR